MKSIRIALALTGLLFFAGCTSYYQIEDPTTGKVYYTTSHQFSQSTTGAATFVDARSGNTVTIQNSHVAQISKEQYDKAGAATEAAPSTQPS